MAARPAPEQYIAVALRKTLEGVACGGALAETPELQSVLAGLEYFLPQILSELHPFWKWESLDGFYLAEAMKTGPCKARLRGICILISDQTLTPFDLKMQVSPYEDEIEWMECRIGECGHGKGGMARWHGHSHGFLQRSLKLIDWKYSATFGEERGRAQ